MKKMIRQIVFMAVVGVGLVSCVDFLDRVPDSVAFTDDEIFTDYTKSLEFINQVMIPYRYLDDNDVEGKFTADNYGGTHGKNAYGLRERITDNCLYNPRVSWVAINRYRNGDFWSDRGIYWCEGSDIRFETIWKAIRITNVSIANVDRIVDLTEEQEAKIFPPTPDFPSQSLKFTRSQEPPGGIFPI